MPDHLTDGCPIHELEIDNAPPDLTLGKKNFKLGLHLFEGFYDDSSTTYGSTILFIQV